KLSKLNVSKTKRRLPSMRSLLAKTSIWSADDTSLSRNGNQYLRYLVEATNSVRRQIPEYSEHYAKKYREVPKNQHKRALVLTARKFVPLVDALQRRKNQIYTPVNTRSINSF